MSTDPKNLKIAPDLHRQIRILAAKRGMLTYRLAEDLLTAALALPEFAEPCADGSNKEMEPSPAPTPQTWHSPLEDQTSR